MDLRTVAGRITALRFDGQNRLQGIALDNDKVLLFPPHVGEQLREKLVVGATVQATALKRNLQAGEIRADSTQRLQTETLTIDGVKFVVR
ncbi:hypothetical protein F0P96_09170 [Hymenobacter busanensis]|uniref:Uncharacterized protein n=1 Tax=Hymenobacter busanensis TaxID=2607656 RepID=A0AA88FKL9_9BACT|nr:hypothetical protein F0P96_09170 [Hymenobacter busanensis]